MELCICGVVPARGQVDLCTHCTEQNRSYQNRFNTKAYAGDLNPVYLCVARTGRDGLWRTAILWVLESAKTP